jgi:hypothetical protein
MKKKFLFGSLTLLCFVFVLIGCSDSSSETEAAGTEKQEPKKPLVEREPEVKAYFEVMNTIIDEYLTVGETVLNSVEKLDSGDLGLLESAAAVQELYESWEEIEELEKALEQQGTIKENIESKLTPKDMLEFKEMYQGSATRIEALVKRLEEVDYEKYLNM